MDCGSAATAAGIDPKILDNWQTDGAFSVASWEHLGYDQPPEWDTSQESSQCADVADLGAFHDPLTGALLDRSRDIQHLDNRCAFIPESSPRMSKRQRERGKGYMTNTGLSGLLGTTI